MVKVALFVRLEAKPGKEKEVESFLLGGPLLVMEEPTTVVPQFPLALSAVVALRNKAEAQGSRDFSYLWCGHNSTGCKEIPAARLTRELASFS